MTCTIKRRPDSAHTARSGTSAIAGYLHIAASAINAPASKYAHHVPPSLAQSQRTIAHVHANSIGTSDIIVVADTRNAGEKSINSAASSGLPHMRLASK